MTCKHSRFDLNCSSYVPPPQSPDPGKYQITKVHREGEHLVLQVQYPNCFKCSFEGLKTLVFLSVSEADTLMWKKIDPHFRNTKPLLGEAPSPSARFPGNAEGWVDALVYAEGKTSNSRDFEQT